MCWLWAGASVQALEYNIECDQAFPCRARVRQWAVAAQPWNKNCSRDKRKPRSLSGSLIWNPYLKCWPLDLSIAKIPEFSFALFSACLSFQDLIGARSLARFEDLSQTFTPASSHVSLPRVSTGLNGSKPLWKSDRFAQWSCKTEVPPESGLCPLAASPGEPPQLLARCSAGLMAQVCPVCPKFRLFCGAREQLVPKRWLWHGDRRWQ